MKISLVIATINRFDEVNNLLNSIQNIDYDKNKIEIIIIDQNKNKKLEEIIDKYLNLNIKHIKSQEKGLSKNRNIGIRNSNGEIICFPDDDCMFLKNTLKIVVDEFKKNLKLEAIMGRIIDEEGKDCIRTWPKTSKQINKINFYLKNSSITLFKRNTKKEYYDEQFGVGARYGACEDADFLFKILNKKVNIEYNPEIVMYHPSFDGKISIEKSESYGVGFGAFCRKNFCLIIVGYYLMSLYLFVIRMLKYRIFFNKEKYEISKAGFKGRIRGFYYYQ